jgi:hypothetical protein
VTAKDDQRARQDILVELNARVRDAAGRFEEADSEQNLWDFTCECGSPDCRTPVSLTLVQYEALRAGDRPVLADGHAELRQELAERNGHRT